MTGQHDSPPPPPPSPSLPSPWVRVITAVQTQTADVDDRTLALERRVNKNRTMRVIYTTEPSRFMDSELELNDAIKEFGTLATVPSLYPTFVELGMAPRAPSCIQPASTCVPPLSHVSLKHWVGVCGARWAHATPFQMPCCAPSQPSTQPNPFALC